MLPATLLQAGISLNMSPQNIPVCESVLHCSSQSSIMDNGDHVSKGPAFDHTLTSNDGPFLGIRSESKVQSDDQKNDLLKRKDLEQFPFRFLEVTVRTRGLFSESELQVYKEEEKLKQ
ncbi:hypothetical protein EXN66_Car007268 [Channa argus]|uniref:Uncharacterized protein n=1 Tax=Channa argus TaxID=215402 RepID=A0A6G1PN44_CHAAH|nr:hypothetical protein EXN66_Car007268 [Channa argus]